MTIQKTICEMYNLTPHQNAVSQFESSYNPAYKSSAEKLINNIFDTLNLKPVECLTFAPSTNAGETLSPHNFLLSNNTTLSIRTNLKGDKA